MKNKTCCFTGHRDIPTDIVPLIKKRLEDEIINLISQGVVNFISGGARGFDTIAAFAVDELKKIYPRIKLILILPYKTRTRTKLPADEIVYASEYYSKGCLQKRNRRLVDGSGYCIYYLTKNTGGTKYTVGYAVKKGLRMIEVK